MKPAIIKSTSKAHRSKTYDKYDKLLADIEKQKNNQAKSAGGFKKGLFEN